MNSQEQDRLEELFITLMALEKDERPALIEKTREESLELGEKLEEMASQYASFDNEVMEQFTPDFLQEIVESEDARSISDFSINFNSDTLTFRGRKKDGLGLIQSPIDPDQVGSYKILKKIGEGGMGRVYLAEANRPKRLVALKIIANSQVNPARFKSEYEALAKMNHEHIARLIDAGDTPDGETFFTMDYVDGKPLIKFCQEQNLEIKDRLALFLQVCDGVQHAHQKAILHRDLKPSNILVSQEAGKATVKIIDFGLAKALDKGSENLYQETQFGTLVGTPLYMSPEQLDRKTNHPDIRGDVYSLGVILYELLTDSHPLDLDLIKNLPLDEGLRICREEICDRPSERLFKSASFSAEMLEGRIEVKKRAAGVRGDLDWIAMKAMDKDLKRRYQTVSELITDLNHYLADEPISARPPSLTYRAGKFIKRYKLLVTATSLTLAALIFGFTLATYSSIKTARAQAQTQKALEKLESINGFLYEMLAAPDPTNEGRNAKIVDLLIKMESQLERVDQMNEELVASIRERLGVTYLGLGLFDEAKTNLEIAGNLQLKLLGPNDPDTFLSRSQYAYALKKLDQTQEALTLLEALYQDLLPTLGPNHQYMLKCKYLAGLCYRDLHQYSKAESYFREARDGQSQILGPTHASTVRSLVGLANSLYFQGENETAERFYKEALPIQRETLGPQYPDTLRTAVALGNCLIKLGKYNEASVLLGDAVQSCKQVFGKHRQTDLALFTWARCLNKLEQYDKSSQAFAEVADYRRENLGPNNPSTLRAMNLQAIALGENGNVDRAIAVLKECIDVCRQHGLIATPQYSKTLNSYGHYLKIMGATEQAALALEEALDLRIREEEFGLNTLVTWSSLGDIYAMEDKAMGLEFAEKAWFNSRALRLNSHFTTIFATVYAENLISANRLDEAKSLLEFYAPIACQQDAHEAQMQRALMTYEEKTGRSILAYNP